MAKPDYLFLLQRPWRAEVMMRLQMANVFSHLTLMHVHPYQEMKKPMVLYPALCNS